MAFDEIALIEKTFPGAEDGFDAIICHGDLPVEQLPMIGRAVESQVQEVKPSAKGASIPVSPGRTG